VTNDDDNDDDDGWLKFYIRVPYWPWVLLPPSCYEKENGNPLSVVPCGVRTAPTVVLERTQVFWN